ncbi:hypothetical protein BDN72DRAFT_964126 [Pluteus cervinus]|uniref:Uncharacterized protein n=1 Tax=Pluteus cervinus TaxID=181527 RepID=A0ACD3AC73_9AGAR|nr:hypothetical protein BDN72DRAFT_964126 [Pluteus cervinus]
MVFPTGITKSSSQELLIASDSSPIACLPPEILPLVFLEVRQASRAKSSAILAISRVSRLWRNIALSTPELWTWIDIPDVGMIQTFLIRAKNRPLSIALKEVRSNNRLPITAALQSLHHIRYLKLSVYYYIDWSRLGPFVEMTRPARALETLHLDGICLPEPPGLPFSGSLPSLRHLHLHRFDTEWKTIPDCPRLRSLCIITPEILIGIPEFLQRLPTFPLLEELETGGIFEEGSGAGYLTDRIELPNLKYLTFNNEETCDVIALLGSLHVPSTCKIRLKVNQNEPDEHLSLFPALATCRRGTVGHIRELKVIADGWVGLRIYEGHKEPEREDEPYGYTADGRSNLQFTIWQPFNEPKPRHPIRLATRICRNHLDLSRLEAIDLVSKDVTDYPTPSFWEFIDSLSTLRALKVRQIYARSFIEYISTTLQSDEPIIPFGIINKLVYEDPTNDTQQYPMRLTGLIEYLRARVDKECPLATLTLVHVGTSQVPGGFLEELRGLVPQVKRKVKMIVHNKAQLVDE